MKNGHLVGGIAIGALVGLGVGYLIGVDSEKRKQWLKIISDRVFSGNCSCEEGCEVEELPLEKNAKK